MQNEDVVRVDARTRVKMWLLMRCGVKERETMKAPWKSMEKENGGVCFGCG